MSTAKSRDALHVVRPARALARTATCSSHRGICHSKCPALETPEVRTCVKACYGWRTAFVPETPGCVQLHRAAPQTKNKTSQLTVAVSAVSSLGSRRRYPPLKIDAATNVASRITTTFNAVVFGFISLCDTHPNACLSFPINFGRRYPERFRTSTKACHKQRSQRAETQN